MICVLCIFSLQVLPEAYVQPTHALSDKISGVEYQHQLLSPELKLKIAHIIIRIRLELLSLIHLARIGMVEGLAV